MPLDSSGTQLIGIKNELTRYAGAALAVSSAGNQSIIVASNYAKDYFLSIQVIEADASFTVKVNSDNWVLDTFGPPLVNVSLVLARGTIIYGKFTRAEITAGTGKLLGYFNN